LLSVAGIFGPVEDALTSQRAQLLSRPPSGDTAIVEIDARSLAELRSWPWPRRYHAQLVRQLRKSGAAIIALDVDFSARSADGDADFASAIRDAGNVILPIFSQKASGRHDERQVLSSRPDPLFADAWVGGVNIYPDADGLVREYPAATFIEGRVQPSIATLVSGKTGLRDQMFQPDWAIDANQIPRFSFVDVIDGRVPTSALKGKRILVGATAIELGDRYSVPRFGVLPGVVIQALAAESLQQGRALHRTGMLLTLFGIVAIALLFAPRALKRPARYAGLCAAIAVVLATGPVVVEERWPVAIDTAAWIFTLFVLVGLQAAIEAKRRLRIRAQFDADSGLPNRSMLERALHTAKHQRAVLVTGAIDRFDTIRDTIGLKSTNDLVRKSADRVSELVGTTVYRLAPDLIAWLQVDEKDVLTNLSRVHDTFRHSIMTEEGAVDVALTVGLEKDDRGRAPVLRIERALAAISEARSLGTVQEWHRTSDARRPRQLSMMSEVRRAMTDGSLRLMYQPKMSLETGAIENSEALIRWFDGGMIIPPDEFIPLAEETGVVREITAFAIRSALSDLNRWNRRGLSMRTAVNVSALDLATKGFADAVKRLLADANVPPSQLALEVTESALIRSADEAIATLSELREQGIRLSVDDYGTGQSTLSYLKHLPVHELKIDKSFVTALADSNSDQILVRSTIDLAHELGLQVVAEGIEDHRTLDLLRDLGCDYGQGYFISRPILPDLLAELIDSSRTRPSAAA
jgi:EAL domain-containing protein (putative c-di-GMP-specific phosphodiesterase class I)/CHASE2 domain-containing sensor protein/GGDEF domain-containing protein